MTLPGGPEGWWKAFYDVDFARLSLSEGRVADEAAAFLAGTLELAPGATAFDQCCGNGRIGNRLGARGVRVVGVDASADYVATAQEAARAAGWGCTYLVGDAFEYVPAAPCDAAFNWYTSFGYLEDDAQNSRMLARAFEALRPGGRFAIETVNVAHLLRHFTARFVQRAAVPGGELEVERNSELDLARGVMRQRWSYHRPDGTRTKRASTLRLYLPHVLADMLRASGFAGVELFGGTRKEACTPESSRCIATARKPA